MTRATYPGFQRFAHIIGSSRLGAWIFARTLHHFDRLILKASSGKISITGVLAGLPVVDVTAIGARSGRPRTVPLVSIRDQVNPDRFALIASNFGQAHNPSWYYNLKANPVAECAWGDRVAEYLAREATGEEYERFWQAAVDTYRGFALYKQRAAHRRIPILVMEPVNGAC